jgi:hypothetical protein
MKTLLIGNGYWGSIVKSKLEVQTDLLYIANSKDNLDDILSKFDVDYVFVCTPTETHYDIVKKCISHHKNIFCEKPFTGDFIKANELYKMAEKNNVKIFVDNIFLYRNEYTNIVNKKFNSIKFTWNKYEEVFKENLFNTLLYHDIYLLLELSNNDWEVNYCNVSEDKLSLSLINNNLTSEFSYDRTYLNGKEKKIIIDDVLINFSNPLNDPLSEIINDLKNNNIEFNDNKKITLKTIKLLNKIQNECLLHTSRHIK